MDKLLNQFLCLKNAFCLSLTSITSSSCLREILFHSIGLLINVKLDPDDVGIMNITGFI